jgi:putative ABC transport system permease protein
MVENDVLVTGIHDNPMRPLSYMSLHQADLMGVGGLANMLTLYPAKGVSQDEVRRALFQEPGVASVQVVQDIPDSFKEVLALLNAVLIIVQIIVVVMAFLITFNSTSISIEERNREIATMLAFGLRIRTVTRMQAVENFITGVLGTLLGIGVGYLVLMYIMNGQVEDMVPDINFAIEVSQTTLITAMILGILVVSLTPLLSIRRMWHMDIPGKLRVLE